MKKYKSLFEEKIIKPDIKFVQEICNKIKKEIIGQDLGNLEIADILSEEFDDYNISFIPGNKQGKYIGIDKGSITDRGSIIIEYANDLYENFEDDFYWKDFCKGLSIVIAHEMVHRVQSIKSKVQKAVDLEDPRNYLSDKWEIMAFAQSAVLEYLLLNYNKKDILKLLKNPFQTNGAGRQESDVFWEYTEWFELHEKPLKLFLKYMFEYLQ